jgi:hypothetical protein
MNMKKEDAKQLADQAIKALQEELKAGRSEKLLRVPGFYESLPQLLMDQQPADYAESGSNTRRRISTLAANGTHVRKGEKGIGIMAPLVYRSGIQSSASGPSSETTGKGERLDSRIQDRPCL